MFYEETLIDGLLHWRSVPNGEWVAKTAQQLTAMLLESRRERQSVMPQSAPFFVQPVVIYPAAQPAPQPIFKPPYEVTC